MATKKLKLLIRKSQKAILSTVNNIKDRWKSHDKDQPEIVFDKNGNAHYKYQAKE